MDPLDLKAVRDTLAVFEAIEIAKGGALNEHDSSELHFVRRTPKQPKQPKEKACYRCGRETCRSRSTCPAIGKTCSNCGKANHFQAVCRSKKAKVHHTEPTLHIEAIPVHHSPDSRLQMRLNSHPCVMELDMGARATLISSKMWRMMGSPPLTVSNRLFTAYDGHRMKPLGEIANCQIQMDDITALCNVTVVESTKPYGLLGRDVLSKFISTPPVNTNKVDVMRLPPMKVEPVSIEITDEAELKFCKARPVPLPLVQEVNKELQRLEDRGIIKPVSSSRWASPDVWVKKRDGSLRMCADFKMHVNRSIASPR